MWLNENFWWILPPMLWLLGFQMGSMFSLKALKKAKLERNIWSLAGTLRAIWEQHPHLREFIENNDAYAEIYNVERQYASGRWKRFIED